MGDRALVCSNIVYLHFYSGFYKGSKVERRRCKYKGEDGKWSDWEQWSDCEYPDYRYCKAKLGFKKSFRACSNPKPVAPGKNCVGMSVKVLIFFNKGTVLTLSS